MNWSDFFAAVALYLVLEGLLPFSSPEAWRKGFSMMGQLKDGQLRLVGLVSIVAGLLLLGLVRS
jgi:uncharacterized protein YjeT (DUF2065 family)